MYKLKEDIFAFRFYTTRYSVIAAKSYHVLLRKAWGKVHNVNSLLCPHQRTMMQQSEPEMPQGDVTGN